MSGLLNIWCAGSFSVGVSRLFWCLRLKWFLIPSAFSKSRRFGCIVILPLFCNSCIWLYNISISFFFYYVKVVFSREVAVGAYVEKIPVMFRRV